MSLSVVKHDEPRIIAELGINHNGELSVAQDLIGAASDAGNWGVKFQYRNLSQTYGSSLREIGDEILEREIKANYLSPTDIGSLSKFARSAGLKVGISFFDASALSDFEVPLVDNFDFIKVPSPELTNAELLEAVSATGLEFFVSTGCHNEVQIEEALSRLDASANWTPLHCISNYPTALRNARIGYIKHMQKRWKRDVGYSSHDEFWEICILAMQMGATVVERHLTYDKTARGLDHSTSSTPDEFAKMQRFATELSAIMAGEMDRFPNQGELLNLQNLGRSLYAKKDIFEGQVVDWDGLELRTPRVGLTVNSVEPFIGKPASFNLEAGKPVTPSLFKGKSMPSEAALQFARKMGISIPVRLHDIHEIQNLIPVGRNEFHLSFGEVLAGTTTSEFKPDVEYSVHLPDYVSSTVLMNPFSLDEEQKSASHKILDGTVQIAQGLQDITGKPVPIVGSFSLLAGSPDEHFSRYAEFLKEFREKHIYLYPQWLPPIAWYFGGSVKLDVMVGLSDIDLIEKYEIPICLDYCHLFMGAAYFGFDRVRAVERLSVFAEHIHIADAAGFDGEGVAFGAGTPEQMPLLLSALDQKCAKVIEVWQGHLDHYAGFVDALETLCQLHSEK